MAGAFEGEWKGHFRVCIFSPARVRSERAIAGVKTRISTLWLDSRSKRLVGPRSKAKRAKGGELGSGCVPRCARYSSWPRMSGVCPMAMLGGWSPNRGWNGMDSAEWDEDGGRINKTLRFCRRCIDVVFILSSLMSTCELDRFVIQTPYIKVVKSCSAPFVDRATVPDETQAATETTTTTATATTDGQTERTNTRRGRTDGRTGGRKDGWTGSFQVSSGSCVASPRLSLTGSAAERTRKSQRDRGDPGPQPASSSTFCILAEKLTPPAVL